MLIQPVHNHLRPFQLQRLHQSLLQCLDIALNLSYPRLFEVAASFGGLEDREGEEAGAVDVLGKVWQGLWC